MSKKVTKYIVLLLFLLIFPFTVRVVGQTPPPSNEKNGNFSKSSFSKSNSWSKNGKALTPPNPANGTGGNPVPISGGLTFLLIGSSLYLAQRIRKENK